jgi:hypothetical protein
MAKLTTQIGFHNHADLIRPERPIWTSREDTEFTYTFENFFHPYIGELIEQLNTRSLAGLFDPDFHDRLTADFFTTDYGTLQTQVVKYADFPKKEIDVYSGPYANYNWELLFHVPLTIAVHLSKNQRFAEAQRWFHYIFDPTSTDAATPTPKRFWRFRRFRLETDVQKVDDLLALLSKPDSECSAHELAVKNSVLDGYEAIRHKPFQPHAVARTRTVAYQYSVVMKYLDNLIAWGDNLFIQDTIESINEATQCYVLAANLLGPRPQRIPPRGVVAPKTYAQLKAAGLDEMGNALVELEGQFPFNLQLPQTRNGRSDGAGSPLFGLGRTLYFCIPRNDRLLEYWNTVADRLFKIRHCMNIEGVVRQLALFDPPIDPGMLVKAAAAGIDIGSIVSGLNQPAAPVRAPFLIQKTLEVCGELRSLGGALLAAVEKSDGEHMALLRQGHEIAIQELAQEVRSLQWRQACEATELLLRTRASTLERYKYYLRLLGLTPDANAVPDTFTLDRRELTQENFDEAYAALVAAYDTTIAQQPYPPLALAGGSSPSAQSGAAGTGKLYLSSNEDADLNVHSPEARGARESAMTSDSASGVLALIPDMGIDLHFWGLGGHANLFGGSLLASAGRFYSSLKNTHAANEEGQAANASKTAGYERRADDWTLQGNLAARELVQLGRQIISSLIAEQIAHHEYLNVQTQIAQAREVDRVLREKFANEELYLWMQGEISRLYYEYYRFAFDLARKAERTMRIELMRPEVDATDYVKFNYWDGGRKGLLAGEALYLDVKRMELAYHENNRRELELTRHVSLRQLDPLALLNLRASGTCEAALPESLYDRDCPGHYMRRLKSVAVSVPAVVGPYTSLPCTLSLLRSSTRTSPLLHDGDDHPYARSGSEDDRFVDSFGSVQQIVTSGGSNDSGMFEMNLRDDRFLPFEGAGAVSAWRIDLPKSLRPFDYSTISDVILHVRYTARQGGDALANQVVAELREMLSTANASGLALLFPLRHDFPTEWSAFANGTGDLSLRLRREAFPFLVQGELLSLDALDLYAQDEHHALVHRSPAPPVPANAADNLNGKDQATDLSFTSDAAVLKRTAADAFLVVRYSLAG